MADRKIDPSQQIPTSAATTPIDIIRSIMMPSLGARGKAGSVVAVAGPGCRYQ